jgi:ABC-type nitrate/sulfonate/bicarbonate transport system substrate-binding protein
MLRRIIPVAALLIQLAYAAISSTPARAIDEIEMGSVGGPTALLWPLYIGTATGMFAAENLDIKQIFAPSSAGVQQQLAAGAFQISDSGLIDQVRAIFEGAPLALVRIEGQVPPYALLPADDQDHRGVARQDHHGRRRKGHHAGLSRAHVDA